jgi:O-antigen ligase
MQLALDRPDPAGKRTFLILALVELLILVMALTLSSKILLSLLVFAVGVPIFLCLPVYPQIILPLMIVTTALDFGGVVIKGIRVLGSIETPVTAFHLAGGAGIIFCAASILWKKRTLLPRVKIIIPLALFLSLIGISSLYAPEKSAAVFSFFRILFLSLVIFLTVILVQSKKIVTLVLISFIGCAVVTAAAGTYQAISAQYFLPAEFMREIGMGFTRATATFTNPNAFATFLMAAAVISFALLINLKLSWPTKIMLIVAFLGLLIGLVASFSRANWLATGIGLFLVALLSKKIKALLPLLAIILCIVLVAGLFSSDFRDLVLGRLVSIFVIFSEFKSVTRVSSTARIYLVEAAVSMFWDHPLLGVGARGFPELFDKYRPVGYPVWCPVRESHTYLATVLAEFGIVGFFLFLWFIVAVIKEGLAGVRSIGDHYLKIAEIGFVAVFIAYQVNMLFTAYIHDNFFWLLTGMLFATKEIGQRLSHSDRNEDSYIVASVSS